MRGRPPKPTAIKKLEGNPGKRPLNTEEPAAPPGRPDMPPILLDDAADEWDRVTELLEKMGILSTADLAVITAYCLAWGEFCDAQRVLNKAGSLMVEVGENGAEQPHPMLSIRRRASKEMLTAAQLLGLSPVARTRVKAGKEEKKINALVAFLKEREDRHARTHSPEAEAQKPAGASQKRGVGGVGAKRSRRKGSS